MSQTVERWNTPFITLSFHFNKQLFETGKWKTKKHFFVGPITSWTVKINVLFFFAFSQITFSTKRCYHYSSKIITFYRLNINSTLLLHYVANGNVKIQLLFFLFLFNHHSHLIVLNFLKNQGMIFHLVNFVVSVSYFIFLDSVFASKFQISFVSFQIFHMWMLTVFENNFR